MLIVKQERKYLDKPWHKVSILSITLILLFIFACGIYQLNEKQLKQSIITKSRLDAQDLKEFEKKMEDIGFRKISSSLNDMNTIGENIRFMLMKFKNNDSYYIHLEFFTKAKNEKETLTIKIDTHDVKEPYIVNSQGLLPVSECNYKKYSIFQYSTLEGIDKQWVGFYFKEKENVETAHGELMISIQDSNWRGCY